MIKFETQRLILRNFISSDIDDFYEYMRLVSTEYTHNAMTIIIHQLSY